MQKVLFITTILLTLFALSIHAEHNPQKRPDASAQFQTVSGHSISLNGIGLAYSYEYAFAPKGTVIFSAGASYAFDPKDPDVLKQAIELTGGVGFDRAIELSKGLSGLQLAVSLMKMPSVDDRGIIAASSVYDKHEMWETSLGFELMCRCPELHFVHPGFVPDVPGLMKEAVEAYEKGYIPEDAFITHRFKPEEMDKAYKLMENEDVDYLKGVVVFD